MLELVDEKPGDSFVCAITSNTLELLHLFDSVFVLHVDEGTLAERLRSRTDNDYGKHPHELAEVLAHHRGSDEFWRSRGAIVVDASPPVEKVVDAILAARPTGRRPLVS